MPHLLFHSTFRTLLRTPKGCPVPVSIFGGFSRAGSSHFSTMSQTPSSSPELNLDPTQRALMEEQVILVDAKDQLIKPASKAEAHLISNDLPLHRAFSLFLFNTKGEMLLQKRADVKATFGGYWTNACCSHPLWPDENDGVDGVKRAVIRKVGMELGLKGLTVDDLSFMTRISYRAEDRGKVWGEHEVDYVLIAMKDVELEPNENEVSEVKFIGREGLRDMFAAERKGEMMITPWFTGIVKRFIRIWWPAVLKGGLAEVTKLADAQTIHRFGSKL